MKHFITSERAIALALLALAGALQAATSNWVAYNDHNRGAGTAANVATYSLTSAGAVGGPLTNYATGEIPTNAGAAVGVSISVAGTLNGSSGTSGSPYPGTPAYILWNGLVDWTNSALFFAGSPPYDGSVTYTFTNLDGSKQYSFRGTFVRAANLTNRWTLAIIAGVESCTPAHATGTGSPGIVTNGWVPYGTNLAFNTQAAWNSGNNTNGDVIGWDHIVPSGNSFSVICSNWRASQTICPLVGGDQGTLGNFYAYAFDALALAEAPIWPLSISLSAPGDGTTWFTDQPVTVGAVVFGGTAAYTNTVFYTNFNDTGWALAGRASGGSPWLNLGPLPAGSYQIYAATTDSAGTPATANSLTNSFIVSIRPLAVTWNTPTNNAVFSSGQSVTATATLAGGVAPYTVSFYAQAGAGPFEALAASGPFPTYYVALGTLPTGTYQVYAQVTDATAATANTLTNTFTVAAGGTTNWVAYNDHIRGPGTAPRVSTYGPAGYAGGATGGPLTNYSSGGTLTNTLRMLWGPLTWYIGESGSPLSGTPADQLFGGKVDWTNTASAIAFGGSSPYTNAVHYVFTNFNSSKKYSFRGAGVRGSNYSDRWTLATIAGASRSTPAHLTGSGGPGIVTNGWPTYGTNLATNLQAAWCSGVNTNGDVIGWDEIVPLNGGFSILCSNWRAIQTVCPLAGGGQGSLSDTYCYAFAAFSLSELEQGMSTPLAITLASPTNRQALLSGMDLWVTNTLSGGAASYTVVAYTNSSGGPTGWSAAKTNTGFLSPLVLELGPLASGAWGVYSTVTDGLGVTATSATNAITVMPADKLSVVLLSPPNGASYAAGSTV
jgi:hypothetical protein